MKTKLADLKVGDKIEVKRPSGIDRGTVDHVGYRHVTFITDAGDRACLNSRMTITRLEAFAKLCEEPQA